MEKADTLRALTLLYDYYPAKNEKPEQTVTAWQRIFEPYTFEEVRTAIVQYATSDTRGFAPKPGQLCALIPTRAGNMDKTMSAYVATLMSKSQRTRQKYHRHGLRSAGEALRDGVKYSEWVRECEERMAARREAKRQ